MTVDETKTAILTARQVYIRAGTGHLWHYVPASKDDALIWVDNIVEAHGPLAFKVSEDAQDVFIDEVQEL